MDAKMTKKGRELLCKAHAGDTQLSPITHIALGEGGCSGSSPIAVTGLETALAQELVRKELESHQYGEKTVDGAVKIWTRYSVTLSESELAGKVISEAGLVDGDGNLVAYLTFMGKGKDQGMEFTFNLDESF